jgi:nitrogen fixation NifU-like protein
MVTGVAGAEPEALGKLAAFAGVCEYPARVKCASLAWHTLQAAITEGPTQVSTE